MIDSFRHFLLIAEHGTFTAAARQAHLSQPAISASIRKLEQDMGASLLTRGRQGAELTVAGREFLAHARAVLTAVDDGRRAIRQLRGLERGEVRIGAGGTACTYLLPDVVASYRLAHPGIRLVLRELTTREALSALEAGSLDVAIVTTDQGERWMVDELIVVGAPDVEPAHAPFVTFCHGSTSRELLDRHFPEIEVVMELGSIAAVKSHVRSGVGLALISRHAAERDLRAGRLQEIPSDLTPIARPMHLVHRGTSRLSAAALAFREHLFSQDFTPAVDAG